MPQPKPMKPNAPKISPSKRRRILEAEGRVQQGQIPTDADLDAVTKEMRKNERNSDLKVNSGFPSFEQMQQKNERNSGLKVNSGFPSFEQMQQMQQEFKDSGGGMKKGGRVRGAGIARKGTRKCKMR